MTSEADSGPGDSTTSPFDDDTLRELRSRQRTVLAFIPDDVSSPFMPSTRGRPSEQDPLAVERALRERIEALISENPDLNSYLNRCRKNYFAELRQSVIERSYRELAGDAPAGMDEELDVVTGDIDQSVRTPTYEESSLLARLLPLMGYADYYAAV